MRRTLALWLLLFGVYASTIGFDAFGSSEYGGDEPHYLLAAKSLVEDGNVDVRDDYAERGVRRASTRTTSTSTAARPTAG